MAMARREVLVQLDDDLVDQLDALAANLGTNRSELLRRGAQAVLEAEVCVRASARRSQAGPIGTTTRCSDRSCVVARNDIFWADLGPPAGRRPVCVLTRDAAIAVLTSVTCAPITRTIRGIRSEVELGVEHGLPEACVISCDNVITIPLVALDDQPIGHLDEVTRADLDTALRYSLDIMY
jgi:mRNA interferase MazF